MSRVFQVDAASGKETSGTKWFPGEVEALACTPDGKRILSVGRQGSGPLQIKQWDGETGKLLANHSFEGQGWDFSRASRWAALKDGSLVRIQRRGDRPGEPFQVDLLDAGRGTVRAFVRKTSSALPTPPVARLAPIDVPIHTRRGVTLDKDGRLIVQRLSTKRTLTGLSEPDMAGAVLRYAFSPDGKRVVVLREKALMVWRLGPLAREGQKTLEKGAVFKTQAVALSNDGQWIATGREAPVLMDRSTWQTLRTLPAVGGPPQAMAFSPDGRTLAVLGTDGQVRLWNLPTGRLELALAVPSRSGWKDPETDSHPLLTFSSDGKRLLLRLKQQWHEWRSGGTTG
jgi:WD40 repeat protein